VEAKYTNAQVDWDSLGGLSDSPEWGRTLAGTVNIVVTCTKQKTRTPPDRMRLRGIPQVSAEQRARRWGNRLETATEDTVSAKRLYAGDHWAVARDLPELGTPKRRINIWIASAGYGLISIDEQLQPYSATFSNPHPDTVVVNDVGAAHMDQRAAWWKAVTEFEWGRERPHSIAELAAEMPDQPLIVVASQNYLHALYDDVLLAREELETPNLLSIISAGTEQLGELSAHVVPADARLQYYVGGVRRSLNVRLARYALQQTRRGNPTLNRLSNLFETLLKEAPELKKYDRTPMTDTDVTRYIRRAIKRESSVTQSRLLRELRDGGNACEQKRFRTLFHDVLETAHG